MAHTQKNKVKLLARIKRIQGQLGAVTEAIESQEECYRVLQTLASARGALQGLMGDLVEGHLQDHIVRAKNAKEASTAGEEMIQIMKSFWK